jgi:DNA-directed RNA polymerase subunit RPC12/RpoP
MTFRCARCGKTLVCPYCATPIASMQPTNRCPHCGKPFATTLPTTKCPYCGARIMLKVRPQIIKKLRAH